MPTRKPDARWKELDSNQTQQIHALLNQFPVQAVQQQMTLTNWEWPHLRRVPTVQELQAHAEDLLLRVATALHDGGTTTCCIGGLRALRLYRDNLDDPSIPTPVLALEILPELTPPHDPSPSHTAALDPNLMRQITSILSRFHFEKVHRTMTLLNWTWDTLHRVPTAHEIQDAAKDLLIKVAQISQDGSIRVCNAGGLRATRYYDADLPTVTHLKLEFILEAAYASAVP